MITASHLSPDLSQQAVIRHAVPTDAAGVAALLSELGYTNQAANVHSFILSRQVPDDAIIVAEVGSNLVGLASLHRIPLLHASGFLGRITSFVVASAFRRQGVGRLLATAVETFAWTHGCERLEVTSGEQRTEAHAFYIQRGYQPVSRRFVKARSP